MSFFMFKHITQRRRYVWAEPSGNTDLRGVNADRTVLARMIDLDYACDGQCVPGR